MSDRRNLLATLLSTSGSAQPLRMLVPSNAVPPIVGGSLNFQLGATGGTAPYAYSLLSGSLPTGTTLSTAGLISGTTSASGHFIFIVQVQDSIGTVYPKSMSITVTTGHIPVQVTPTRGTRSIAYSYQVRFKDAAGSSSGFTFSLLSGTLPSGLSISSGGLISGTPGIGSPGTYPVTIRGTKSSISLDVAMTITIGAALSSGTLSATVATGMVNQPISGQVSVAAGTGTPPYSFEVTSGALPAGVKLERRTGKITGTPTAFTPSTGWTNPVVTVTDAVGASATVVVPFQINQGVKAIARGQFPIGTASDELIGLDYFAGYLGDGVDGDVVLDGTATHPAYTKVGFNYTQNRPVYANSVTFGANVHLDVNDYPTFIRTNTDISAANVQIESNGGPGALTTGGAAHSSNWFGQISQGGAGAVAAITGAVAGGTPTPGANVEAIGTTGAAGNGGTGSGGGASGGGGGPQTGNTGATTIFPLRMAFIPFTWRFGTFGGGVSGPGGGAGGGNGTLAGANGGAGGSGGGVVYWFTYTLTTSASTSANTFSAAGGAGANGVAAPGAGRGAGGGGSGGAGGIVWLVCVFHDGPAVTDLINVSGGARGLAGATGSGNAAANGNGASSGFAIAFTLSSGDVVSVGIVAAVAGGGVAKLSF